MLSPNLIVTVLTTLGAIAATSVKRIPEGHAYTLRRIGGRMRTLGAGIHLTLPLLERVMHKINLTGNVVEVNVPAASADTAALRGRVYFQVMDVHDLEQVAYLGAALAG